ncbi:MAG: stress responsive alpha-beta barrel domain-containing protein [Puniceicoccaceae bacterium 5H]|nr:MAG: stress responsive alpha-beta barrel domain-containing protein [Puniceicoccaceae bacterium 5H]
MFKHVVFFRFHENALDGDAATNARKLKEQLELLPSQIKEIQSFEIGLDVMRSERSWDLALVSGFDDREAMQRYQVHPAHQEVIAFVKQVCSEVAAVDYEL